MCVVLVLDNWAGIGKKEIEKRGAGGLLGAIIPK